MLARDRQNKILERLNQQGSIKVSKLIELFNVSIETVRRDLEYLEKEGLLKRVYGGAVLEEVNSKELNFKVREIKDVDLKKEIAKIATRYVKEGDSIALDVSTTNHEFAKELKNHFNNLTIITNSINIALELSDMKNYNIVLVGGLLRHEERCLVGNLAETLLDEFHIDTTFLSMSGISVNAQLTDYGFGEVGVKKKMICIGQKTIVLAQSTKFDVACLLNVATFDDIDMIITDSKLNKNILQKYLDLGVDIINK
ncbi:DeoR/GlpR family DNA-binding transcription regulator [Tepidibacter aestuarii]|uniref:DeoR/GlpR family DNA-binding transcription regulator n=1 Tax=Tepidibacter aestuarii TaxID=2925782 RepID=UPI0020C0BC65|nr:DeoR/GlpR family DNA-binding transcription regulator [Tepidibacter aestuarii]CAH2212155.1 Uncharacterized HTH-type transcriptional regulator YulB [Tepidibacter aestuarii]